ncbi:hypothetical protein THAOC_01952, partial [Thalassiosira oceanica]
FRRTDAVPRPRGGRGGDAAEAGERAVPRPVPPRRPHSPAGRGGDGTMRGNREEEKKATARVRTTWRELRAASVPCYSSRAFPPRRDCPGSQTASASFADRESLAELDETIPGSYFSYKSDRPGLGHRSDCSGDEDFSGVRVPQAAGMRQSTDRNGDEVIFLGEDTREGRTPKIVQRSPRPEEPTGDGSRGRSLHNFCPAGP